MGEWSPRGGTSPRRPPRGLPDRLWDSQATPLRGRLRRAWPPQSRPGRSEIGRHEEIPPHPRHRARASPQPLTQDLRRPLRRVVPVEHVLDAGLGPLQHTLDGDGQPTGAPYPITYATATAPLTIDTAWHRAIARALHRDLPAGTGQHWQMWTPTGWTRLPDLVDVDQDLG